MNIDKKQPTMKDVALEAGVALGTVSKVFNGLPVGDEYRIKVEKAAKKLGYQVNVYARGLRAQKTYTIALVFPNLSNPFYSGMADYCCEYLNMYGYRTLLATTSSDPALEQKCVDMVQQNKVDGIIAITYNPDLEINENIPFVIIDRKFDSNIPCVSSDNFAGGELAAEKLVENGCKNLIFLSVSSHVPGEADKRMSGFINYCEKNKISHAEHVVFDEESIEAIYAFIDKTIKTGIFPFDGIFCNTDLTAVRVIKYLKDKGISIPQDVQVIGYDGIKNFGFEDYYCTTIRQPLKEMAMTAVDIIIGNNSSSTPSLFCLPVTYCYGGTTRK